MFFDDNAFLFVHCFLSKQNLTTLRINFYQNNPKMKLCLQEITKFLSGGGSASRPPHIVDFWLRACILNV